MWLRKSPLGIGGGNRAEIIWRDEYIERFAEVAQQMGKMPALDGLRSATVTGLRREDLVTLTWDQIGEFAIPQRNRGRAASSAIAHPRASNFRQIAASITVPRAQR
jgi:hypothetical protein